MSVTTQKVICRIPFLTLEALGDGISPAKKKSNVEKYKKYEDERTAEEVIP